MVDTIITANKTPKGLDLFFFLPGGGRDDLPAYVHSSRLRTTPAEPMSEASLAAGPHWSRDLIADGQPWMTMEVVPMPGGPLTAQHGRSWVVLAFGLILTSAVVIYIRSSRRYAFRIMRVNQKVSELAQMDALTSLANRRAFLERLGAAFAACRRGANPFSILYFDLDHFKDVNDTLGHAIGDALLRHVASRVIDATRENDTVARFGGDEFAILQSDTNDIAAAGALAAKIGQILAEPYFIEGNEVHISVSIGISRYTPDVPGPDAMIIQADLALYRAKEDGRNCYRFHSADLDREVQDRVVIGEELRGAPTATSSSFTTSRKSNSDPVVLSDWRRCCAGTIPSVVGSHRRYSSPLRSAPARSRYSADGCSIPPAGNCDPGRTKASRLCLSV